MHDCICHECFEDAQLKKIIEAGYEVGECKVCGSVSNHAIPIEELGKLIEPIIKSCFEWGQEIREIDDNDRTYWKQEGDPLDWVVSQILGQDFDCHDDIVEATIDAEHVFPQDGDEAFISREANYVEATGARGDYLHRWTHTLEELKHSRRFFSPAAQDLFGGLFKGINTLHSGSRKTKRSVIRKLKAGTKLYRARPCLSRDFVKQAYEDPIKHLGPPSPVLAKAGRMNAEGVVVFYGAMDKKTCVAEMRPALSSEHLVIQLETTQQLRILDFSLLEEAWDISRKSYFDPAYAESLERLAFLKLLHQLISRPIVPGNENEYLITQTMAEYLAHVHEAPVDGILFESAQRAGGKNIVLFKERHLLDQDSPDAFPLRYFQETIERFSTISIQYKHIAFTIGSKDSGPALDPDLDIDSDWPRYKKATLI